jgi:hypothetical protein
MSLWNLRLGHFSDQIIHIDAWFPSARHFGVEGMQRLVTIQKQQLEISDIMIGKSVANKTTVSFGS